MKEPVGPFEFVDRSGELPSILPRRNSRTSVVRSHTFNSPNVNNLKMNSDEMKSTENVTCQSTPELSCSNERERERNELLVNIDETAGLATSGTILTSTSLTGLTPTASGTIDDKNEVQPHVLFFCAPFFSSFLSSSSLLYHRIHYIPN